jgi:hypothetical protein
MSERQAEPEVESWTGWLEAFAEAGQTVRDESDGSEWVIEQIVWGEVYLVEKGMEDFDAHEANRLAVERDDPFGKTIDTPEYRSESLKQLEEDYEPVVE